MVEKHLTLHTKSHKDIVFMGLILVRSLASSRNFLTLSVYYMLIPHVLTACSSLIAFPSRVSSWVVVFSVSSFDLFSLDCLFCSGVSGIGVSERGSAIT